MILDNVKKCIEEFGMEEIAIFVAALQKQGSRHLLSQFDAKTVSAIESIVLTVTAPQGAYFASEGRSGNNKYPPLQSIKDWAKDHSLQPFRDKKGRFITDDSRAFLISRKIATLGTRLHASHFLAQWKLTEDFSEKALMAFKEDLRIELQQMIDQFEASQS